MDTPTGTSNRPSEVLASDTVEDDSSITAIAEEVDVSSVLVIDDDTDLDAAANFDTKDWLRKSGVESVDGMPIDEIPSELLQDRLKTVFALPSYSKMASNGQFSTSMSSPIRVFDTV